jgi:all-trans-retinol 13,14-reductase
MWDAIVIGSGIGGLAAASALGKRGRKVLLLEQHSVLGGLTQTFRRQDWTFATGVHYIGGVGPESGPESQFGRMLAWLSDGALQFAPCDNPYDIVRLPGFEFGIAHPESAYRNALLARFPHQEQSVRAWFDACEQARRSAFTLFAMRGLPSWLAFGLKLWRGAAVERWAHHTLAAQLEGIQDPHLRAVLGGRWGDYGAPPESAPFLEHALVTGSYNAGAYYPVGGPARFAQTLLPAVHAAGGEVRANATVRRVLAEGGRAVGVVVECDGVGRTERAHCVVSAMGAANTVACLEADVAADWRHTLDGFSPGLSYLSLYLGFEGDIRAAGASSANVWLYETEDVGRIWHSPADEDAPGLFVSFPSLKDPSSAGPPTAEVVAPIDAAPFAAWMDQPVQERPEQYLAFKAWVEERMLAQFVRHFPRLQPLLRFHELSTPVTQRRYVRAPNGAMYGLEMSADRMLSPSLRVRTPLLGLLLAGQDVVSPGVAGAFMGGWMAAASIEPSLWAVANR